MRPLIKPSLYFTLLTSVFAFDSKQAQAIDRWQTSGPAVAGAAEIDAYHEEVNTAVTVFEYLKRAENALWNGSGDEDDGQVFGFLSSALYYLKNSPNPNQYQQSRPHLLEAIDMAGRIPQAYKYRALSFEGTRRSIKAIQKDFPNIRFYSLAKP